MSSTTWAANHLHSPLVRIKIDETNCFGRLEWPAIREAALRELPRHAAVAAWKHQQQSYVEQPGVPPHPKDRGAEQGDVDGPLECGVTIAGVAASARESVHRDQCQDRIPWAVRTPADVTQAKAAHAERDRRATAWAAARPVERRTTPEGGAIVPDPRHEIQPGGGIVDYWYLDDGDVLTSPHLVAPFLRAFDAENVRVGAQRNRTKTEVILYGSLQLLEDNREAWEVDYITSQATILHAGSQEGVVTLGVVTGEAEAIGQQVIQKAQVVRAMYHRAEVCQDAQTEHVLGRLSLGVCRLNHLLRVHGHDLHRDTSSLQRFDDAAFSAMARLFPGITKEGQEQAALAVGRGGLGWRKATDTALAANLAALIAATPKVHDMAKQAARAGLIPLGTLEAAFGDRTQRVKRAFLDSLDEAERGRAEKFILAAARAAEEQWLAVNAGQGWTGTRAPRADATFAGTDELASDPVDEAMDATPESRTVGPGNLQRELCRLLDCTRLRALERTLTVQNQWQQLARLRELRHPEVSHSWLWHLDHTTGAVLSEEDYVLNVQKRLGAGSTGHREQ
jgi:hypothetical protein